MSVLVNTQNEQQEKVLLAFLDSLHYSYQSGIDDKAEEATAAFIDNYNKEIEQADAEIEAGNYIKHDDVEHFFQKRRKAL
ncbi:hypothetical protein [Mucilaginibacter sp. 3215]|uniref:hypothetical protein n=1 Tax=Mucilaginibacter sp. 3215 TaxID=3373912 RepID=UPI003D1C091C